MQSPPLQTAADPEVRAVYYGGHGQQDGAWIPAKECPVDGDTGRLLGFVGLRGHGVYHTAGVQSRSEAFFLSNEMTSSKGRLWGSKQCLLVGYPDEGPLTNSRVRPCSCMDHSSASSCSHGFLCAS